MRTIDAGASEATTNIGAYFIPAITDVSRFALVNIDTTSAVVSQSVPLRTTASVRAGAVFAYSDA